MKNSENSDNLPGENEKNTEVSSPYEKKVEHILEELEYLSLQNDSRGIKLADFTPQQKKQTFGNH